MSVQAADPNQTYVLQLYVLDILFPVLATIAVALRFISRRLKRTNLWWDDWIALLALAWEWIAFACVIESIHHGKGKHLVFLSTYDRKMISYWSFWFSLFYTAIPPTIKVSALLLYRRIFATDSFNRLVTAMLIIVPCWGLSSVLISIFGCTPVSAFWTHEGKCINEHSWVLAFGIPNIVLDVTVWAMPIPRIWIMNLPLDQKINLTVIFLIGLVDCAIAILRLAGSAEELGDADTSYNWAPAMWWGVVHTSLGIVVICLPTMRILVTKASDRLSSFKSSKHTANDPTSATIKPSRANYITMRDLGMTLTGEHESSLHSNAIALGLQKSSDSQGLDAGIHVQYGFSLANRSLPSKNVSEEEIV